MPERRLERAAEEDLLRRARGEREEEDLARLERPERLAERRLEPARPLPAGPSVGRERDRRERDEDRDRERRREAAVEGERHERRPPRGVDRDPEDEEPAVEQARELEHRAEILPAHPVSRRGQRRRSSRPNDVYGSPA